MIGGAGYTTPCEPISAVFVDEPAVSSQAGEGGAEEVEEGKQELESIRLRENTLQ